LFNVLYGLIKQKKSIMKLKSAFNQPVILLIAGMTIFSSCKKDDNATANTNTITDIVVAGSSFTSLESAVVKADLQGTLSAAGPYTVFAPDDAAFTASGITASVLNSLTRTRVKDILLYHTISGKINAADVPAGPNAKVITAGGDSIFVSKNANGVFVNGIKVNNPDVAADTALDVLFRRAGRCALELAGQRIDVCLVGGLDRDDHHAHAEVVGQGTSVGNRAFGRITRRVRDADDVLGPQRIDGHGRYER